MILILQYNKKNSIVNQTFLFATVFTAVTVVTLPLQCRHFSSSYPQVGA